MSNTTATKKRTASEAFSRNNNKVPLEFSAQIPEFTHFLNIFEILNQIFSTDASVYISIHKNNKFEGMKIYACTKQGTIITSGEINMAITDFLSCMFFI